MKIERITKEFVFNEHILKMDYSFRRDKLHQKMEEVFNKAKRISKIPFLGNYLKNRFKREYENLEERVKEIEELQEIDDKLYNIINWFFEQTLTKKYCKMKYVETKIEEFKECEISLWGEGIEHFDLNGKPFFIISEDKTKRETLIPIIEGSRESNLSIYEHPQIPISPNGKIIIDYKFNTRFSIGNLGDKNRFTKDPFKKREFIGFNSSFEPDYFYHYGSPGKVHLREGDATIREIEKSCTGNLLVPSKKRKNFDMQGQIYLSETNQLLYQGHIDCNGFFPFFIQRDDNFERNKKKKPKIPDVVPLTL